MVQSCLPCASHSLQHRISVPARFGSGFLVVKNKSPEGKEVFLHTEQSLSGRAGRAAEAALLESERRRRGLISSGQTPAPQSFFGLRGPKLIQNLRSGLSSAQDKGWSLPGSCGHSGAGAAQLPLAFLPT